MGNLPIAPGTFTLIVKIPQNRYYSHMKPGSIKKIPLLAVIVCISLAVVVTEDIAAYELAHHEFTGEADDSAVSQRAKAAADFLDTLRLACLFLGFTFFSMLVQETFIYVEEFIPCLPSLVALEIRSNS